MDIAELDRDVDIRRDTGANHAPRWLSPIIDHDHRSIKLAAHTQLLAEAINDGVDPSKWPRIRILPVVFKGTYDEANWRVLRQRWDELRAQLHGVVIPESSRCGDALTDCWIDEINAAAPNFSPSGVRQAPPVLASTAG